MTTITPVSAPALAPAPAPGRWTTSTLGSWRRQLPVIVADEFIAYLAQRPELTADTFEWNAAALPHLAAFGDRLRDQLEHGYGLCQLRGLGNLGLSAEQQRCLYLAIGCAIGDPMLQYGRLYPVVDRGKSYTKEAVPVSMTNAETAYHTDSSSVDAIPDVVALLCEQPSTSGGDSLVSNALRVFDTLQAEAPWALEILSRPWIRDVVTPGIEKTHAALLRNRFPVFARCERTGGVLFRYMRYWIERGQEKAGNPLTADERRAFDLLDELLARPENVIRFRLERGDAMFVNNRTLAHNRTSYVDAPGNVRQLQRLWLTLR